MDFWGCQMSLSCTLWGHVPRSPMYIVCLCDSANCYTGLVYCLFYFSLFLSLQLQCYLTLLTYAFFTQMCLPYDVGSIHIVLQLMPLASNINLGAEKMSVNIFSCTFKEREVLPVDGHLSPSEHSATAGSSSAQPWLPILFYCVHIKHYILIRSNCRVKPQQPLQCYMKVLTSTNKHVDPVVIMSCCFLHHYSNDDFLWPFWQCCCLVLWICLFQVAQRAWWKHVAHCLIVRHTVRVGSCVWTVSIDR